VEQSIEAEKRLREQKLAEARQREEEEKSRQAFEDQRRKEQAEQLRREIAEDDKAKGEVKGLNGELATRSAYIRNQSNQVVKFQLLTSDGWEPKMIKPNGSLFLMSESPLKLRWWEGPKYRKQGLGAWTQPHWSFNGVNPDEMKKNAPVYNLTVDSDGAFMFDLADRKGTL
jgi:hypothetical protein